MKYVLYFGFWIAVFYAVIRFGMSVIEDVEHGNDMSGEGKGHVDPVCGMSVSDDSKITSEYKDKRYYFCAEGCKESFDKEPGRYIS